MMLDQFSELNDADLYRVIAMLVQDAQSQQPATASMQD